MDVDLPGLKVALVARPPVYGGRVKSLNDREARGVAGVRDVFEVPIIRGGIGVAVVADTFWMAKQARDRLNIEWNLSGVVHADTSQMRTRYTELSRTTGNVAVSRGDVTVLDRIPAADRIVADFSFPYLAHTPMEPLNTTIRFDGDRAEAWVPSQFQTMDQIAIAEVLGLKPEQVTFHTEYAGGGFGRRTPLDSHVQREAAAIAKRLRGTPVKVMWTREDDVQGGYYRPMFVHHVEVGIDARGMPAAWRHVVVGQSHIIGTGPPWEGGLVKNGVDELVVEGTADSRYAIPNFHVSAHQPTINVPVAQWRSVGMTHNAFVMETLIDELAVRAKIDPIAYRLVLLRPDAKKLAKPTRAPRRENQGMAVPRAAKPCCWHCLQRVSRDRCGVRGRGVNREQSPQDSPSHGDRRRGHGNQSAHAGSPVPGRDCLRPESVDGERGHHVQRRQGQSAELRWPHAALHEGRASRDGCAHRGEHRSADSLRGVSGSCDFSSRRQRPFPVDWEALPDVAAGNIVDGLSLLLAPSRLDLHSW